MRTAKNKTKNNVVDKEVEEIMKLYNSVEADPTITAEDCEIEPYDVAEFLKDEEHYRTHIRISFEENGLKGLKKALGDVARARSMSELSKQTGISRQYLYKALSAQGNPSAEVIFKILEAFNLKVQIV